MDCAVFPTYRCNARCGMCGIWMHPTRVAEEFSPDLLDRLPPRLSRINISGGEPTLRSDLAEIVGKLLPRTTHLELSTNGWFPERLEALAARFPELIFRVSIEGLPERNDRLRGLRNGFDRALRSVLRIRRAGARNVGFAMTISGENHRDLLDVYDLCASMGLQLANAVVHNSFYFRREDNAVDDPEAVAETLREFVRTLLRSRRSGSARIKDWFRAYINLGLLGQMQGRPRPLACTAGTDAFFLDPAGRILACNGSAAPIVMGDLHEETFDAIWNGPAAAGARELVARCDRRCWMTGTAVPAMKRHPVATVSWVLRSKLSLARGGDALFGGRE